MNRAPFELDVIQAYRELTPLRHIKRFAQHACIAPMSVAAHSFYVAMLAGGIAKEIIDDDASFALKVSVPRATILGLWHDVGETIATDIPASTKWEFPALGEASDEVEALTLDRVSRLAGFFDFFVGPDTTMTPEEEFVVKLADATECVLYVYEEERAGNQGITYPKDRIVEFLAGMDAAAFGPKVRAWHRRYLKRLLDALRGEKYDRLVFTTRGR